MLPALASLIALQELDTAGEAARKRLSDLPGVEQQFDAQLAEATAAVDRIKATLSQHQLARRDLEKRVAVAETRLARFDEHKAAVKTNQEFTALLHEIETARTEKDGIESEIIALLETEDQVMSEITAAEADLATQRTEIDAARASLQAEREALGAELARLGDLRATQAADIDRTLVARYEQLLKQRRMVAVAPLSGDICGACHVRLRPAVTQQVRRNTEIITCDNCKRILFAPPTPPPDPVEATGAPA